MPGWIASLEINHGLRYGIKEIARRVCCQHNLLVYNGLERILIPPLARARRSNPLNVVFSYHHRSRRTEA